MNLALWHVAPGRSRLRPVTETPTGSVAIRSLYSMISTGTERIVALGSVSERAARQMSVPYMEGRFPFPVKYGYSLVGEDPDGQLVHCMHPHQAIAYVSQEDLFPLPGGASARRMALISNSETCLNAIWDAAPLPGRVVVCGFGSIGALLATTLRLAQSVEPIVVERDAARRRRAVAMGFETHDPAHPLSDFELAFNSSGNTGGLQWCIDHGGLEARIVELSWYGNEPTSLRLGERFHYNRLRIISSQVSTIAEPMRPKMTLRERKKAVVELLQNDEYDQLLDNEVDFAASPAFFSQLCAGRPIDGLTSFIKY